MVAISDSVVSSTSTSMKRGDVTPETMYCQRYARSRAGHVDVVRYLLNSGAPIDDQTEDGFTALSAAAFDNRLAIVELLLDSKADMELQDINGRTPLMRAAGTGRTEIVKLLITRGARTDWRDRAGLNAEMLTVQNGHEETARVASGSAFECCTQFDD
jgi:ankyrin repeat protein